MRSSHALLFASAALGEAKFWMEEIPHQGIASFNPDKNYTIFRNVKDFGAKGDGVTDDTTAINLAISFGGRCGVASNCTGSTLTPAVVYFPEGTYLISNSLVDYYYTQLIGSALVLPTIKASPTFTSSGIGMLDGDPYSSITARLHFRSTDVFFRQVRNMRFDTRDAPGPLAAIHWPSSQATSLQNCVFILSQEKGAGHVGIFMEEGSGGFLGDLVFYGGEVGAKLGNQQYTARNLTFYNSETAVEQLWSWGWTYKEMTVVNCGIGLNMTAEVVGSVALVDSCFVNTPIGILTGRAPASHTAPGKASLILSNVEFENVRDAVRGPAGVMVEGDETGKIVKRGFVQGNLYAPSGPTIYQSSDASYFPISPALMSADRIYSRSKPTYADLPASNFISARAMGAQGDGSTDDTDALNKLFALASHGFASGKVAFLDAGYYRVLDTVYIPPNTRVVGEGMAAVILGSGGNFCEIDNPKPIVRVGQPGGVGRVEWSDTIVSTKGGAAGATGIEWNLAAPVKQGECGVVVGDAEGAPSGMWDVHVRLGGFAGSMQQKEQCEKCPEEDFTVKAVKEACIVGYLSMHITKSASNLYVENSWIWVADHDIEDSNGAQISLFAGRGLLVESVAGRIWLVSTSVEHHVKYQYQLVGTRDVWIGLAQTETPYFQPNPPAPLPFTAIDTARHDPDFSFECEGILSSSGGNDTFSGGIATGIASTTPAPTATGETPCAMAWALRIIASRSIFVFGAGLYSFFNNYDVGCSAEGCPESCQRRLVYIGDSPTVANSPAPQPSGQGWNATVVPNTNATALDINDVEIYTLNTIGAVNMITRQGHDVARSSDNKAGFTSIVALFKFWASQGSMGFGGGDQGSGGSRPGFAGGSGSGGSWMPGFGPKPHPISGPGSVPSLAPGPVVPGRETASARPASGYMCIGDWHQLCWSSAPVQPTGATPDPTAMPGLAPSVSASADWPPLLGSNLPCPPAPVTTCSLTR